jgi:hypothetical protein
LGNPADFPKPVFIWRGSYRDTPQLIYITVATHLRKTDMKRIIPFLILAIASLTSCKNEPKENKKTEIVETKTVENSKTDDTEKINEVFEKFKGLYNELNEFKNTADFKKYGFGEGGKNRDWLEKIRELKDNPDSKLLIKKGILIGELEQLGMAYASSNGKETEVTKTFNKIFSDAISPNSETENTEPIENSTSESWYEGGNLHKADGTEWKKATEHNKLATCADFTMTIAKRNGETPSVFSAKFKKASESLKDCIDKFYKLSGSENTTVTKVAIECLSN